jgi:hypothetical protein
MKKRGVRKHFVCPPTVWKKEVVRNCRQRWRTGGGTGEEAIIVAN